MIASGSTLSGRPEDEGCENGLSPGSFPPASPSELFKNFKLNKAAAMLRDHRYNVSEVADLTGFGTLANFSRAYKKKFGVPPSEFK